MKACGVDHRADSEHRDGEHPLEERPAQKAPARPREGLRFPERQGGADDDPDREVVGDGAEDLFHKAHRAEFVDDELRFESRVVVVPAYPAWQGTVKETRKTARRAGIRLNSRSGRRGGLRRISKGAAAGKAPSFVRER